jgi:CBS domain-containing protein
MNCPYCGHGNLDGSDDCEECRNDLSIFDLPAPTGGLQSHLMEDTVRRIPFDRLVLVNGDDSVAHAVARMKTTKIGQVIVVENGKLIGILTERDLLNKIAGQEMDLQTLPVNEVMTKNPEAVGEREAIRIVINKMAVGGYRHVPIVRDGRPVGLVSAKSVANYVLKFSGLDY